MAGHSFMMLAHTCARGVRGMLPLKMFDKNGAIWCILSAPKYVIINLKINNFLDNKSTTQICAIFFSKINPNAYNNTKINTFTFYRGMWGTIAPRSQKSEKLEAIPLFHQILHTRRVYSPVIMWIQIRARGSRAWSLGIF